jgi:phosphoglycolate phosphatase
MSSAGALLLFDIDGTLIRAGDPNHGQALLDAFEVVFGPKTTLEGINLGGALDGNIVRELALRHALEEGATPEQLNRVMSLMGKRYRELSAGVDLRERVLPGVHEAVQAVIRADWLSGVLTGNARDVAQAKLEGIGLDHLMETGAFGDLATDRFHLVEEALASAHIRSGKRYSPSSTVLIGDTPVDIAAARGSGSKVIAVATGRWDEQALAEHQPDALLPDLRDPNRLVTAIEQVLGPR